MKASVSERYGGAETPEIREVPKPQPGPRDLLIRVHASTVSRTDHANLAGVPKAARIVTGLFRPKHIVQGMDFAGEVEAVGKDTSGFEFGDRVFGLSPDTFGAHAEYMLLPARGPVALIPDGLGFEDAVVCEGVWYAKTYLDAFDARPGQSILIYGASGAIGIMALQIAVANGLEVTAVAGAEHLDLLCELGATRVIDYRAGDFTQGVPPQDYVLDAVGKTRLSICKAVLKPDGVYSATDFGYRYENIWLALKSWALRNREMVFPTPKAPREAVLLAQRLLGEGRLRAVVDRTYPLAQIADAYRYVGSERKTGIVLLKY